MPFGAYVSLQLSNLFHCWLSHGLSWCCLAYNPQFIACWFPYNCTLPDKATEVWATNPSDPWSWWHLLQIHLVSRNEWNVQHCGFACCAWPRACRCPLETRPRGIGFNWGRNPFRRCKIWVNSCAGLKQKDMINPCLQKTGSLCNSSNK